MKTAIDLEIIDYYLIVCYEVMLKAIWKQLKELKSLHTYIHTHTHTLLAQDFNRNELNKLKKIIKNTTSSLPRLFHPFVKSDTN